MDTQNSTSYEFGPFRLVPAERQLLRDDQAIALPPKAFDTLLVLVQHNGHALKKDDLIRKIWPDSFVEESNLNHNISLIRKVLSNGNNGDGYVETVRGYGFRFNAHVLTADSENSPVLLQRHTRTHVVIKEAAQQNYKHRLTTELEAPHHSDRKFNSKTLVVAGVLILCAVGGLAYTFKRQANRNSFATTAATLPEIRSIAVLPFKSLDTQSGNEYLGLGMADALITKLGRFKHISIRPTSAIQKYATSDADAAAIARELQVDAVLEGRIQKSGNRLRLTVQLVSVHGGASLWTEKFDETFDHIFVVQDSIARRVADELLPALAPEQTTVDKQDTVSAEAYDAYLKGRYLWSKRTTESLRQSIVVFQEAIARDPNFALAYDGLADAYLIYDAPKAEPTLRKALELDETLAEAHASLGFMRMFWHWDWLGAEEEFKRAIELKPRYGIAHQWYALYLAARGKLDEATKEMKMAVELDPGSPNMRADLAQIYYFAHEYDEALAQCQKALELDAEFAFAHDYMVGIYAKQGRYLQAVEEQLKSDAGQSLYRINSLREAFVRSGWRGFLQYELESEATSTHARKSSLYAMMGDKKNAIKELEKACDDREFFLAFLKVEPAYDDLRADPRFQALLLRMDLGS